MGFIGVGWMGDGNLDAFLRQRDCRVVAIADVDQRNLLPAVDKVNEKYKNKDCKGYKDFRELLARSDIDAVCISNPKYGCGPDDQIGPLEVSATAEFPPKNAVWNTATKYRVECKYPNNVELVIAGGYPDIKGGTKWIGENGWIWVDRGNDKGKTPRDRGFDASNPQWIAENIEREKKKDLAILLPVSPGHQRQFLDCMKSRQKTLTPVEIAHRSQTPGHLGYIASVVGRTLKWDAVKQEIVGDAEASKLLSREMRAPWHL